MGKPGCRQEYGGVCASPSRWADLQSRSNSSPAWRPCPRHGDRAAVRLCGALSSYVDSIMLQLSIPNFWNCAVQSLNGRRCDNNANRQHRHHIHVCQSSDPHIYVHHAMFVLIANALALFYLEIHSFTAACLSVPMIKIVSKMLTRKHCGDSPQTQ